MTETRLQARVVRGMKFYKLSGDNPRWKEVEFGIEVGPADPEHYRTGRSRRWYWRVGNKGGDAATMNAAAWAAFIASRSEVGTTITRTIPARPATGIAGVKVVRSDDLPRS